MFPFIAREENKIIIKKSRNETRAKSESFEDSTWSEFEFIFQSYRLAMELNIDVNG